MKYQWLIPLAAAIGNAALGIVVLTRDRQKLHAAFAAMTCTLVLWNLDIFGLYFFADPEIALVWAQVFRVGPILAPTAVILFAYLFAGRGEGWRMWGMWASAILSAVLLTLNAFALLVVRLQQLSWGYYPVGTRLYHLLTFNFIFALVYSIATLFLELRTGDSPRKRLQARLWVLAATVAIPLGLTNLLPAYGVRVYPLGNLANLVYVGVVAYAIIRHRLMDIDVVVTKGMAYLAVASILIAPTFGLTLWLQRLSFGRLHPDFSFAILVMLVAVGVLFPALRLRAESRIEQSFFRKKHEYRSVLAAFTHSIVRILDRDRLIRELASTLSETLQLDRIAVALSDDGRNTFTVRFSLGMAPALDEFAKGDRFVGALRRCRDAVLRDELEGRASATERPIVSKVCQQNGWQVCIPLSTGGNLMGFISLGGKRNFDAFFAEDLELLGTVAAEASVALENARLYEELKKSQDIIRRADRLSALGTLAAGIAHEIRNPLVSIQTFFQLAPDRLHDEEFFTTFLRMTAKEVTRISDLITELLSFARSPARSLRPIDLNESVERVVTLLEPEARKHGLKLATEMAEAAAPVRADADQIKQVLINLILNAIQATKPGGTVTVATRSVQRGDVMAGEVEVADTGEGMPREQLDHIFDPFFTTKDKGTGLGLAIVHQIVVEHGGSISVDSTQGRGTRFIVDLPVVEPNLASESPSDDPTEYEQSRFRHEAQRKVLAS